MIARVVIAEGLACTAAIAGSMGNLWGAETVIWIVAGTGIALVGFEILFQRHHHREQKAQSEQIARIDTRAAADSPKLDELLRIAHEMRDATLGKAEQTAPVEAGTKQALEDALDRLAREAAAGSFTAAGIVERRSVGDVVDFLSAREAKIEAGRESVNARVDEELIAINREKAAVAYLTGRIDDAEGAAIRLRELLPSDMRSAYMLGSIALLRGHLVKAEEFFSAAKDCASDDETRALALGGLGGLRLIEGNLVGAERLFEEALAINRAKKNIQGMALDYRNLGTVFRTRGDLAQAEAAHEKSLELCVSAGNIVGTALNLGNLGIVYMTRGELDRAQGAFTRSLATYEALGVKEGIADQYGNLGFLYLSRGQLDRAEAILLKSIDLEQRLGRREGLASDYGNLGLVYRARGELDASDAMIRKSLAIDQVLNRAEGVANSLGNLGVNRGMRGDWSGAMRFFEEELAAERLLGRKQGIAGCLLNLGIVHKNTGRLEDARSSWAQALSIFVEIGATEDSQKVRGLLAELEEFSKH